MDKLIKELKEQIKELIPDLYDEEERDIILYDLENATTYVGVMEVMSTTWSEMDAWWFVHNSIMKIMEGDQDVYSSITWPDYS